MRRDEPELATQLWRILHRLGDLEGSLTALSRALEIRRKALGPTHPKVAAVHNQLGATYADLGRHEDALREHEEALELFTAELGPDSQHLVSPLSGIAAAQHGLGNDKAEVEALTRAIALGERTGIDARQLDALRAALAAVSEEG
jgi:tetratricopeptide (TPR) repeat protein